MAAAGRTPVFGFADWTRSVAGLCAKTTDMRHSVMIGYWCVVVLMLASVMASCGYEFRQGVFLSTTMLPGMFCAKLSLPGALRASNRRAVAVAGVAGGILVIEWLALLLAHRYIWSGWLPGDGMVFHVLFYNPVFIGLLLAAVLIPEMLLDH